MEENNMNNMNMNNMNNLQPTKKSGSTGLGIVIGLMLAVIIGLVGFITYDKFLKEENKESSNNNQPVATSTPTPSNKETEKDLSLDSDLVKKLSRVVGAYRNDDGLGADSDYKDYFYKKDKVILANETDKFRLSLVTYIARKNNELNTQSDSSVGEHGVSYISEETVKNLYANMFGKESYVRSTFDAGCQEFKWSTENNRYESLNIGGCGGISVGGIVNKILSAKQITTNTNDKIEILEVILKKGIDTESGKFIYFGDYEGKTDILESIDAPNTDDKDQEILNKYKDKADKYKYTFVKDSDGTYVFTSVEKVK